MTNKIKTLKDLQDKLKDFKTTEDKRTFSSPYNERIIGILTNIIACYNVQELIDIWNLYQKKYGPYIKYEDRKKAKDLAEEYLAKNIRKTKSEKNKKLIWEEYEKLKPPEYDEYIWAFYHVLEYICDEQELIGPIGG